MTIEELRDIRSAYRNCFSTLAGKQVLAHMLVELGFFNTASSDEEVTLQNYAKVLLNNMGIISADNVPRMVESLLALPVRGESTEEEGEE